MRRHATRVEVWHVRRRRTETVPVVAEVVTASEPRRGWLPGCLAQCEIYSKKRRGWGDEFN